VSYLKLHRKVLASSVLAVLLLMPRASGVAQAPVVPDSNDAAFRRVSNRLLCQCSCNYMVLSCNHVDCPSATFIRKTIQTSLAAGKSEDAIVAAFVQQYGPRILPEPPKKGFSLTAWVMPFAVLLLGGALLSFFLWQWKAKYRLTPAEAAAGGTIASMIPSQGTPASNALVEKYRAQIDRELENQ
jgi:cytochrome c-type biogenesis protein CcmH/NrfF